MQSLNPEGVNLPLPDVVAGRSGESTIRLRTVGHSRRDDVTATVAPRHALTSNAFCDSIRSASTTFDRLNQSLPRMSSTCHWLPHLIVTTTKSDCTGERGACSLCTADELHTADVDLDATASGSHQRFAPSYGIASVTRTISFVRCLWRGRK